MWNLFRVLFSGWMLSRCSSCVSDFVCLFPEAQIQLLFVLPPMMHLGLDGHERRPGVCYLTSYTVCCCVNIGVLRNAGNIVCRRA